MSLVCGSQEEVSRCFVVTLPFADVEWSVIGASPLGNASTKQGRGFEIMAK